MRFPASRSHVHDRTRRRMLHRRRRQAIEPSSAVRHRSAELQPDRPGSAVSVRGRVQAASSSSRRRLLRPDRIPRAEQQEQKRGKQPRQPDAVNRRDRGGALHVEHTIPNCMVTSWPCAPSPVTINVCEPGSRACGRRMLSALAPEASVRAAVNLSGSDIAQMVTADLGANPATVTQSCPARCTSTAPSAASGRVAPFRWAATLRLRPFAARIFTVVFEELTVDGTPSPSLVTANCPTVDSRTGASTAMSPWPVVAFWRVSTGLEPLLGGAGVVAGAAGPAVEAMGPVALGTGTAPRARAVPIGSRWRRCSRHATRSLSWWRMRGREAGHGHGAPRDRCRAARRRPGSCRPRRSC